VKKCSCECIPAQRDGRHRGCSGKRSRASASSGTDRTARRLDYSPRKASTPVIAAPPQHPSSDAYRSPDRGTFRPEFPCTNGEIAAI